MKYLEPLRKPLIPNPSPRKRGEGSQAGDCPDFRPTMRSMVPKMGLSPSAVPRCGVSLLEVLISIFVLSIGLLGVAAVIPVAGHEILQAVKADRAAAIGPSVIEDMKVRGMLNPGSWQDVTGALVLQDKPRLPSPPAPVPRYAPDRGFEFGESFAIDPLYIAKNQNPGANRYQFSDFPYNPRSLGNPILPPTVWVFSSPFPYPRTWTRLQRITLSSVGLSEVLASSGFMWHDDLVIPVPDDDTARPRMMFFSDTGSGKPFPQLPGEPSPGNALYGQNAGDYTYMVTVSPSAETVDFALGNAAPFTYPENIPQYEVSVVVFYKRDLSPPSGGTSDDPPSERQVELAFLGSGLGGGDVRLSLLPGDGPSRLPYLDVK
ncbi:MAG: prepilin-type N-terminal cleavage/methylation domain-containing protein, partial [Planctomycetota bacterium]